jgi:hypothetical protein
MDMVKVMRTTYVGAREDGEGGIVIVMTMTGRSNLEIC